MDSINNITIDSINEIVDSCNSIIEYMKTKLAKPSELHVTRQDIVYIIEYIIDIDNSYNNDIQTEYYNTLQLYLDAKKIIANSDNYVNKGDVKYYQTKLNGILNKVMPYRLILFRNLEISIYKHLDVNRCINDEYVFKDGYNLNNNIVDVFCTISIDRKSVV